MRNIICFNLILMKIWFKFGVLETYPSFFFFFFQIFFFFFFLKKTKKICFNRNEIFPVLELFINFGHVLHLDWCPANSKQQKTNVFFFFFFSKNDFWFTVIKIKKDHIGRLGLLGVVFGNGSLGVFSIPDPTELKEKHRNEKPLCKDTIFFFPQKIY